MKILIKLASSLILISFLVIGFLAFEDHNVPENEAVQILNQIGFEPRTKRGKLYSCREKNSESNYLYLLQVKKKENGYIIKNHGFSGGEIHAINLKKNDNKNLDLYRCLAILSRIRNTFLLFQLI